MLITSSQKRRILKLKARHGKLIRLMAKYKKRLHSAKTEKKKASAQKKISRLEGRINGLLRKTKNYIAKASKVAVKSLRPKTRKSKRSAKAIIKKSREERIARVQKLREKKAPKSVYGKDALNDAQIDAGAKFMAASNLGALKEDPKNMQMLQEAWRNCMFIHESEGIDVDDERKDWEKKLRKGDKFTVGEVRKRLPWIFDAEIAGK